MPNYHFFKQGQSLTYLDANAPSYSDERRHLVAQGFAAIAVPTFADSPSKALELLCAHQKQHELHADGFTLTVSEVPASAAPFSGK